MSLSSLIFITVYGIGSLMTLYNPVFGILTYVFEWHNHPPYYWWGDSLPDLRWAYTISLLTLGSWAIHRARLPKLTFHEKRPAAWLFFFALNAIAVSLFVAIDPNESLSKAIELVKVWVLFLLMTQLVRTYPDYRKMIWVIMVCVGYLGWIAFNEGSNRDIGVKAPNATEENAMSAHVMTVMAFYGIYFLMGKRWEKILLAVMAPFCLNLIILANSRGTFLGLVAIGALSIYLIKGRFRWWAMAGMVGAVLVFFSLTNEQFWERQSSTTDYKEDNSAMSRFHIWEGGWEMLMDRPYGLGGMGFVHLSMAYIPEITEPKSQHNTFVAAATDWGFQGIFFYMGFLTTVFLITVRIKRRSKLHPDLKKYMLEGTALQLAIVGISVAGLTHSRQYNEVVYWLGALTVMLTNIQETEISALQDAEEIKVEAVPEPSEAAPVVQNSIAR